MDGIFVFDGSNDLILDKLNHEIKEKLLELAQKQGLLIETNNIGDIDNNVIIQIFSPLITSQKIMFCQFDNSYSSIQCEQNFTIVLEDYLGYLFIKAGSENLDFLQKSLKIFISCVKHVCGPNVHLLKTDTKQKILVNNLYDCWLDLYLTKQTFLVEGVEQLLVNAEVKSKAFQGLRHMEKFKDEYQKSHGIIFVKDKLLTLYSNPQAQVLSAADLIFLNVFTHTVLKGDTPTNAIHSNILFLEGVSNDKQSGCIPNIVHVTTIFDFDIVLVILIENTNLVITNNLFDVFFAVQKNRNNQSQGDVENIKQSYEVMDLHIKSVQESFKKLKSNNTDLEENIKVFGVKWDIMKKSYLEYFKTKSRNALLKIESNLPKINDSLKELFSLVTFQSFNTTHGLIQTTETCQIIQESLASFQEFIMVKSTTNFSITSYLEEFPGLVHFIHVDRSANRHRITAPNLEITVDDNVVSLRKKVWSMVEFTRQYLDKGHLNMMWKDIAFNYTYFMWFEDQNGMPVKPKTVPNLSLISVKPNFNVGILAGNYYERFIEACFPKTNPKKIKCYELYCVHLGLVTSLVVLEHCRRLAATINDIVGTKKSFDLL